MASRRNLHRLERHATWLVPCLLYLWAVLPAPQADGRDLMPFPDAEEYALLAARLARGEAPLIAVGAHLYPSRYSLVYPLPLAPLARLFDFDLTRLFWASALFGLVAVALMARVGGWLLGSRTAGALAAVFWALHPQTVSAATVNMSETAIVMVFFLALELARPWLDRTRSPAGPLRAVALGLALGWLTLAKAPFVYWAVALAAIALVQGMERRRLGPLGGLLGAGLACLIAELLYRRWAFGAWNADGYVYWFPPVYAEVSRVFHTRYLTVPWLASWPDGNLAYYGRMMLGETDDFYSRYMPVCAAAAAVGALWPWRRGRPTFPVVGLLAGWTVAGALFCGLYFFQSPRFPHLWTPVIDLLAAWGLVRMPFWTRLRRGWAGRRRLTAWGRLAALLVAAVLLRGEAMRVRGHYHLPDDPRRLRVAYADQIRPLLDRVPADAWLATNYQLPLVDAWRPHPGPTVALNAWYLDNALMNGHVYAAWAFGRTPHATRADWRRWLDPLPDAWRTGPTLLITAEDRWTLDPARRQTLFARPFYILVVKPPLQPDVAKHFEQVIRPMLEREARLQPIQATPDVTLYRVRGLAGGVADGQPSP